MLRGVCMPAIRCVFSQWQRWAKGAVVLATLVTVMNVIMVIFQSVASQHKQWIADGSLSLVEHNPKFIHVLAYQRTASSLLSHEIGSLPGHFFMFEPLDMTFTALYGLNPGNSNPSDLFNYNNGQARYFDSDEIEAMQWTLKSIFNCTIADHWPVQFLLHHFTMRHKRYAQCLFRSPYGISSRHQKMCLSLLQGTCQGHYEPGDIKMHRCKSVMWHDGHYTTPDYFFTNLRQKIGGQFNVTEIEQLASYFSCMDSVQYDVRECAREWLEKDCKQSKVRMVKTVRASMEIVGYFLSNYPQYSLIHLFRDPRGTANSRFHSKWATSRHERKDIASIASRYCQNVLSDYFIRQSLEIRFSSRIIQILTDDFMINPMKYIDELTNLLNMTNAQRHIFSNRLQKAGIVSNSSSYQDDIMNITEEPATRSPNDLVTRKPLTQAESRKLRGQNRINKWEKMLNKTQIDGVRSACSEFYKKVPFFS